MNEKILTKLMENYRNIEKILTQELMIDENSVTSSAEEIWQPIFQRIVPTKYNVEKNVYIIDSYKNVVKSRLLCKMLYNVFTISTYQN